ncbi:MAG: PAAR-like protein [Hydrogenoanaerobacterium sp.]
MNLGVTSTAMVQCSSGTMPTPLNIISRCGAFCDNMQLANILDSKPFLNILPFGMCSGVFNPHVMMPTAEAYGVLTPMPCTLSCAFGGVLTITVP